MIYVKFGFTLFSMFFQGITCGLRDYYTNPTCFINYSTTPPLIVQKSLSLQLINKG